jgi:hypothetical protein
MSASSTVLSLFVRRQTVTTNASRSALARRLKTWAITMMALCAA